MKKLAVSFLFLLVSLAGYSQNSIYLQGKVVKPSQEFFFGDTLEILGIKTNLNTGKVQYTVSSLGIFKDVSEDRIEILDHDFDFWEMVWLKNRGSEIAKKGWEAEKRQELHEDALDYYMQALSNKMVFQDDLLYDYIYRLINQIHPTSLIKEKATNFSVIILNSTEPKSFAFDNGMIVLTAGLIASTDTEAELVKILSQCVAHSVLEHNLVNFNRALKAERKARIWGTIATVASAAAMAVDGVQNGTFHDFSLAADLGLSVYFLSTMTLKNIGAEYSGVQNKAAAVLADDLIREFPEILSLDNYDYAQNIASTITYTAWQEYQLKNYSYAKQLAEKLNDMDLASDRDYLLLSRVQRKTSNTDFSNQLALDYIVKGKSKSTEPLVDLDKEAGLIYSRLNQPEKAQEAFLEYRRQLMVLRSKGQQVDNELQMMNEILQRRTSKIETVAETDLK